MTSSMITTRLHQFAPKVLLKAGRADELRLRQAELDRLQVDLQDLFSRKRHAFPRFHFVSDGDILGFMCDTVSPAKQGRTAMSKCFPGVAAIQLDATAANTKGGSVEPGGGEQRAAVENSIRSIVGVSSSEGELVPISRVLFVARVEEMLNNFHKALVQVVQKQAHHAAISRPSTSEDIAMLKAWIVGRSACCQAAQVAWMVVWCKCTEAAIQRHDLVSISQDVLAWLDAGAEAVRASSMRASHRAKVEAIVLLAVRFRDVGAALAEAGVESIAAFEWLMLLRFYWAPKKEKAGRQVRTHAPPALSGVEPSPLAEHGQPVADGGELRARQLAFDVPYGFEYHGAQVPAAATPLTDRCVVVVTQALAMHCGANVLGRVGVGKTELVRDLARSVGLFLALVACASTFSFHSTTSLCKGLAESGAWLCIDGLERTSFAVLSVLGEQLVSIARATQLRVETFELLGQVLKLQCTWGFLATTATDCVDAREAIPLSLRAYLRPVTVVVPDLARIAEAFLLAQGFARSERHAAGLAALFQAAPGLLLQRRQEQVFSLRMLHAVIHLAGAYMRARAASVSLQRAASSAKRSAVSHRGSMEGLCHRGRSWGQLWASCI